MHGLYHRAGRFAPLLLKNLKIATMWIGVVSVFMLLIGIVLTALTAMFGTTPIVIAIGAFLLLIVVCGFVMTALEYRQRYSKKGSDEQPESEELD